MKYIPADKLIAKIQPYYENAKCKARYAKETGTSSDCIKWDNKVEIYEHILRIISHLQQEQPDVDLDVEIANYLNKNVLNRINNSEIIEDFTTMEAGELARYFYELGINARNKD